MHWVRDPPCLVLQWVDNKVVSMITVGNKNEQGQVTRRVRTDDKWGESLVKQTKIFKTYNMVRPDTLCIWHPAEMCAMVQDFLFPSH